MTKNTAKIKDGLKALAGKSYEIISGTVVPGSLNNTDYTIAVQPSDEGKPIEGVVLNSITEDSKGIILFPADDSNVIIGSVDGPGEWTVLKTSELEKVIITIDNVICEIEGTKVNIQNGDVVFNVGTNVFKINTPNESLFQLLKDCFTYLTLLTVPTSSGPSGVPVNAGDFVNLLTRLNNLLAV